MSKKRTEAILQPKCKLMCIEYTCATTSNMYLMKPNSLSWVAIIANDICKTPMPAVMIFIMCILVAVFVFGKRSNLEGMMTPLNPEMEDLKKRAEVMETAYAQLKNGIQDQTNRIQGNAQMLLKILNNTPNQTNSVTHANVNMDDPSKTRIPKITI